jgi:hypothetical protein
MVKLGGSKMSFILFKISILFRIIALLILDSIVRV